MNAGAVKIFFTRHLPPNTFRQVNSGTWLAGEGTNMTEIVWQGNLSEDDRNLLKKFKVAQ